MCLGILITRCISKLGLCSRKAAIRISTETGQELVNRSVKLGRNLTTAEIESVFEQTLPKKLKPKIITSTEQAAKEWSERTGMALEDSKKLINDSGGGTLSSGRKKAPIFVNFSDIDPTNLTSVNKCAVWAHELEHALEYNCRPSKILHRKIIEPLRLLTKDKGKYNTDINSLVVNFKSLIENKSQSYTKIIEECTRNDKNKINILKFALDNEIPAHIAGNNVIKYINKLGLTSKGLVYNVVNKTLEPSNVPIVFAQKQGNIAKLYSEVLEILKSK